MKEAGEIFAFKDEILPLTYRFHLQNNLQLFLKQ